MYKKKIFYAIIIIIFIIGLLKPISAKGEDTESVYQVKDSNGHVALSLKIKDGQITINTRDKVARPNVPVRWRHIGLSISRKPITNEVTAKGIKGPGPLNEVASSGLAYIYFDQAVTKTQYIEGNEVFTTIIFSEEQIKTALQDDFTDITKGTTIYLHGIFRTFKQTDAGEVIRKDNIKNWTEIVRAEEWANDTLLAFNKYFNMPIQYMPKAQENSMYYITNDSTMIAPRKKMPSKHINESLSWSNEPTTINYYDSDYKLKGYYVTRKIDKEKVRVQEGFISKGVSINQIKSGQTKVLLGGMNIYMVYEKEEIDDNLPPLVEPLKEDLTFDLETPLINGKIGADPKNQERFQVDQGIPVTESLYTNLNASPYMMAYQFEKKVGIQTYPVKVRKEYILTWTNNDGPSEVPMSEKHVLDQTVNIRRAYGYWEIINFDLYSLDTASINNYALPEGKSHMVANSDQLKIPIVNIKHSSKKDEHIIVPKEIINGISLKAQTIYGDYSKPSLPSEDFTLYANKAIPNLKVKNDSLVINGNHVINETLSETEGPNINTTDLDNIRKQGKAYNTGSSLFKENLIIDSTKANGNYHSSGQVNYKRTSALNSKHSEKLDYNIPNINSVLIHTPVVCKAVYSSNNNKYIQNITPTNTDINLILDNQKDPNDFTIKISNNEFHSEKKGYGTRDYSYSLRDRNSSYIASKDGKLRNEIKFPFDIYKYSEDKERSLINKNTWIILDRDTHEFSLPIWIREGSYIAECRTVAINANMSKLEQTAQFKANTDLSNYVATDQFDIEVSGRLYGLTIYDVSDYPMWEDIFRVQYSLDLKRNQSSIYMDGTKNDTYQKNFRYDYTSGTNDQYGNKTDRLSKYTFPLVDGSHPEYLNQGILKTGYGVRFQLTTIGNMYSQASSIRIRPKFYCVDKSGNNRQEVSLYYEENIENINRKLVKIGSFLDSSNMKHQEVGNPYTGIPMEEINNTIKIIGKDYASSLYRRKELFNFSDILIASDFRTFPIDNSKYTQNWYGSYYLPCNLYVTYKDFDVYEYASKYGISFREDFWIEDGYLIVNFDIRTLDSNGNEVLSYDNMWEVEGMTSSKVSYDGLEFDFIKGDFIIYKINSSIQEDYIVDGL